MLGRRNCCHVTRPVFLFDKLDEFYLAACDEKTGCIGVVVGTEEGANPAYVEVYRMPLAGKCSHIINLCRAWYYVSDPDEAAQLVLDMNNSPDRLPALLTRPLEEPKIWRGFSDEYPVIDYIASSIGLGLREQWESLKTPHVSRLGALEPFELPWGVGRKEVSYQGTPFDQYDTDEWQELAYYMVAYSQNYGFSAEEQAEMDQSFISNALRFAPAVGVVGGGLWAVLCLAGFARHGVGAARAARREVSFNPQSGLD